MLINADFFIIDYLSGGVFGLCFLCVFFVVLACYEYNVAFARNYFFMTARATVRR